MSDCGVCISGYEGDGECIGYRKVIVRAGKQWRCCECGRVIPKKSRYELASWFWAGSDGSGNAKTCVICAEIADAFSCGGRYDNDSLWETMQEVAFPRLTTACFDRLKTPEAKAELRRRWMEWKGIMA